MNKEKCKGCGGSGWLDGCGYDVDDLPCPDCGGFGYIIKKVCE